MEVTCLGCKRSFYRSKSLISSKSFCNKECRKTYSRLRVCGGCKIEYCAYPVSGASKHCSWECFKKSRWVPVICITCEKPFDKRLSEINKAPNGKHLCSRGCRNVYTSKLLGGDGSWTVGGRYRKYGDRGKGWRRQRMLALERDHATCQQCEAKADLEVHHWEPYNLTHNNDLDNLVTLCRSCHQEVHKSYQGEGFYEDFYREVEQYTD